MAAVARYLADTSALARLDRPVDDQQQLRDGFERLAMPDAVWQRVLEVQAALARKSADRGAALPDLLIAATAERHGVTLLHYDHEYELIAAVTEQAMRWIVPRGTTDAT